MGIAPDGKTLWVNSKISSTVYAYSPPDVKLLGGVPVGDHPDWLTFTPDSKSVHIANETAFQKSRPRLGLGDNSHNIVDRKASQNIVDTNVMAMKQ